MVNNSGLISTSLEIFYQHLVTVLQDLKDLREDEMVTKRSRIYAKFYDKHSEA